MRRHVNESLKTNFANSGRIAGDGISHDRYDDESGCPNYERKHKSFTPCYGRHDHSDLNGPVITYKIVDGVKLIKGIDY